MKKRILSVILAISMFLPMLPTFAFAEGETAEDEQIRETLRASVNDEQYPQGMFDFLTPRMETSEDVKEAEFAIVRRGNTDEAASVTFKAIDMTAKYDEDYTLEVPGMIFDKTLPENPEAQPLIYDEATTDDNSAVELMRDDNEDVSEENVDNQPANTGSDLRSARTALTGMESDYTNWREADEQTTEMLSDAYGEMYDELEGVEYTLEFEPGEYIKKLKFITIDDKISEDEEQALFVLSHPENCAVSENPTGFMNIKDNEEAEEITFGFSENSITVGADGDKAELIIERKTGLYRYGTVTVSSAEYTAAEGVYYDGFATEIAFVPGQEYKRIEIPIKKHPAIDDVSFKVYIDDSNEVAVVNIEHGEIIGEQTSGDDIVTGGGSNDVQLMSDDIQLMAANDDIWTRYKSYDDMQKTRTSAGSSANMYGLDLSMVGKISFETYDQCNGTYRTYKKNFFHKTKKWWERGSTVSYLKLYKTNTDGFWDEKGRVDTKTEKHDWTGRNYKLSDSDRKSYDMFILGVSTGNGCSNADVKFRNIKAYYLPVEVQVGMYDDDAMIQKKIYTSPTSSKNDSNAFLAGKIKFKGENASTTSKFFYNNDTVSFDETDRTEKDNTYLWGIKFETKAGSTNKFFYYKGDSFSIKDLYTGNLKDVDGKTIGSTAKLTDKRNGEDFTCYRIYPVYKQKAAYTTIKIDTDKSQFATGTFKNEETIKTGVLDKIQINIAGKGDYAVSGFNYGYGNRYAQKVTTTQTERDLYSEKLSNAHNVYTSWSPIYNKNSDWTKTVANADVSTPGNYLFAPLKTDNSLEALYQKPEISVAVNPRANSEAAQKQGFVAYMDDNGKGQTAKYTGKDKNGLLKGDEIKVSAYKAGSTYQFIGGFNNPSETGYKFQWQDFTGDINRDGQLSSEEIKALGSSYNSVNKGVYAGDIFNYVPNIMGSPIVYFNIVPKSQKDTGFKNMLSGNVLLKKGSVIENSRPKPSYKTEPIVGANITAGGYTTTTDENGKWKIEASEFDAGETYTATLAYGGRSYTGDATVNRAAVDFIVDEYNTFNVKNFNAYQVTNDSEYENVEDWNLHPISNTSIDNKDVRHLYTFEIDELVPTTATVGKVEVERHSSDGMLKKTYTAVYNDESEVYEVKDPVLLEQYKSNPDAYNYSFNPAAEAVAPGDYLTVRVYDQNDVGYIKHNIGFTYKPKLSVINIVNSFKSPLNPTLEFIGDIDMAFDLGLTAKMDTIDNKLSNTVNNKLNVETTDDSRTISFGWNKDFKKSYDSNKKKDDKDKKDPESSEPPKTAAESVKEEAKKLENASDDSGKDEDVKKGAADTAKDAVDKKDEENKKSSQVTSDLKVNLSVALELVMGYDSKENRYYFKDFVVTGVVSGDASAKYAYTTPIGIVLFVKGELSGDITAMMAIEPYYQNPAEPNYLYMDEAGTIDLTKLGNSDVNRQLSIYGKLMIRPKITLSVGMEVFSDKIASVTLSGGADFDMVFTTALDGAGKVTLSSELTLKILGGMIEKKWSIVKKDYDMFSINSGTLARLMSVDEDYRYDVINSEDTDEKLYLANRSEWNGNVSGDISLFATGTEQYNEHILQAGAYPHAYPQIFVIDEGTQYNGSDTKQIMFFLDSDETGTELKYSIYEDGEWSKPQLADNDGTNDDTPQIADLGDKLLVTWSSEGENIEETDYAARLNSRDIKSVFFDKQTMTFGNIQFVTKTTEADISADDYATAAYYVGADGKKSLMISYIKTIYEQTEEELTVGDLLNAYSVIAYRFYDFENNEWVDTYPEQATQNLFNTMSADDAELFRRNWYGQNFIDLSEYVTVDESNIKITEDDTELSGFAGLWSKEPDTSEITLSSISDDPQVVEHEAITYDKYAVSAYLIDLDKQNSTTEDREIFLQLYDFENDKFYPAIRLTNDAYNQSYLTLSDTPDGAALYYISNGSIAEQSISNIIDNIIETTASDGTEVLLNNKTYSVYSGENVIIEADENNPYTEFIVNSDGNNVYLTWTENGMSFKDGIDRNSNEATMPENYYSERQMYMAMETFDVTDYPYTDEDGNPICYPQTDDGGNVIDWSVTPDVNGETGKVSAGDSIIEKLYSGKWTKPVQMTDEQGAHYDDIDCVMVGNGVLRCVYLKGMSEITDILGTSVPAENTDNRALVSADFDFNVERYTLSINNAKDIIAGREEMPIDITVKNESLLDMFDVHIALFMTKDGESELIDDTTIDKILGGNSEQVTILWNTPDELDDITLTAYVEQGGIEYGAVSQELVCDNLIEITDISHEILDRNTAEFTVSVINNGSENVKGERVYVNCNGVVSKSDEFDLVSGDTAVITFSAEIPEEAFEESRNETTITETAPLKVYTNNSIEDYEIIRSADITLEALMNKTIEVTGTDGKTYTDKIQMTAGDLLMLESRIDGEDAVNYPRLNIVSDNDKVVSVTNGVLTAEKSGTAKLNINLYPSADTYTTNENGYMQSVDTYNTLPSCLIKTIELTADVAKSSSTHSGGGSSSKATPKPAQTPLPTETKAPSENKWFTDVSENAWYYNSVKYAFENGLMVGISNTEFAPETDITRAMFVTVLYRMENEPDISNEILGYPFADVDANGWYGNAVYWARLNGIVEGYSDTEFAPDENITREQMAAIVYRYAKFKEYDTELSGELAYSDNDSISDYAKDAVIWSLDNGIMFGNDDNTFAPLSNTTRAQAAAIFERITENLK